MAFSLAQLAFLAVALVVAIGVPLAVIPFARRGSKDDLARPFKLLNWGFWLTMLSFVLAMALQSFFPPTERNLLPELVADLSFVAFYGFGWLYWTSLAVLAQRRGQSASIWVVAGLATLAIGFFATYILMGLRVRALLKTKQA